MFFITDNIKNLPIIFPSLVKQFRYSKGLKKIHENIGISIGILVLFSCGLWLQRPIQIKYIYINDKHLPIGLYNPKNFCYLNSLLQALAACPSFVAALKRMVRIRPFRLLCRLVSVIESLRCSSKFILENSLHDIVQLAHKDLIKELSTVADFDIHSQQDVHELYITLCQNIFAKIPGESELVAARGLLTVSDIVANNSKGYYPVSQTLTRNSNLPESSFQGQLPMNQIDTSQFMVIANRIVCSVCHLGSSPNIQTESAIFLYLDPKKALSVEQALSNQFIHRELLKDILCPRCEMSRGRGNIATDNWIPRDPTNLKVAATCYQEMKIVHLPDFLIFFVQRGQYNSSRFRLPLHDERTASSMSSKRNQHIKFSHKIDMSPFTLSASNRSLIHMTSKSNNSNAEASDQLNTEEEYDSFANPPKSSIYNLSSIIEHKGVGLTSGHYVTYKTWSKGHKKQTRDRNNGAQRWIYASDDKIAEVSFEEVAKSQAYILFYEKDKFAKYNNRIRTGTVTTTTAASSTLYRSKDDCYSTANSDYDFDRDEYLASLLNDFQEVYEYEPISGHYLHSTVDDSNRTEFIKSMAVI